MATRRNRRSAKPQPKPKPAAPSYRDAPRGPKTPTPEPEPEEEPSQLLERLREAAEAKLATQPPARSERPADARPLSVLRLLRPDTDGHDGRRFDTHDKWYTPHGVAYVSTMGELRVYSPGSWWGLESED